MHDAQSPGALLSIGVPVYNGERYLEEALESALGQEYPNLEVLISDNASTDSTPEICRRFEADSRVRYARSRETTDPITNFGRVLGMARGTYFTWLAHDDVLTSPDYAATLVTALAANPDAILCASELELFTDDDPNSSSILRYAWATDGRAWQVARRGLFRWPPDNWETLIYGVFRREVLKRHFSENPSLRFPLQRLASAGRFIVVPTPLRGYRLHEGSLGRRRVAKSEIELLLAGLGHKARLLREAMRVPVPLRERLRLIGTALRNFLGNHLAWAHSVRGQIRAQEAELASLRAAAREREDVLRRNGGQTLPPTPTETVRSDSRRSPGLFRRPDADDTAYLAELAARVRETRRICDELLAAIERQSASR